jgi:UDP-N-acetylmuramyl pentapeptide phosphotransferase/UDP-N-acetylglucosamine-1-phosphate transferase
MTAVVSCTAVAGILAWALLFALLRSGLALRIAVDKPNRRSLHSGVVPRIGGLVVVGVALVAMLIVAPSVQVITVTALGLMLLFAVDDRRGLSVRTRLLAQLIAAAIAAYTLQPAASWWFVAPIIVAIVWSMNLYNFMDGSDGLAGGMTLFGFGAFAVVASNAGAEELATACACVAGAAAGFLLHNFPPAKVFLGDAGSVPLGFLAAVLGIAGWQQQVWPLWFPVLTFSPFIVDASVTLMRRAVTGERVWEAHREHLYQRMVTNGWGHARTAVTWYAMMALAAGSAIAAVSWPIAWQIALLLGWLALYAVLYACIIRLVRERADEA